MRWQYLLRAALVFFAALPGQTKADIVVYAVASSSFSSTDYGSLDLTTGQFSLIATLPIGLNALTSAPNGTLYASGADGNLYTIGAGGSYAQFGTVNEAGPPSGFGLWGLANAGPNGFYAFAFDSGPPYLPFSNISPDGNSVSTVGNMDNTSLTYGSNVIGYGTLAFGPNGTLYYDAGSVTSGIQIYRIDTATGAATPVGTDPGSPNFDTLTLVTAGGQLYGIDGATASGSGPIAIYTINTTTGQATPTGVDVTGLPIGDQVTGAASVPEPSSLTLALCGGLAVLCVRYTSRCRKGG